MKCPYCGKKDCITHLVHLNAENYGGNVFIVPCLECGKKIRVIAQRRVVITSMVKAREHEDYSF